MAGFNRQITARRFGGGKGMGVSGRPLGMTDTRDG
jgi:hypothetical protein